MHDVGIARALLLQSDNCNGKAKKKKLVYGKINKLTINGSLLEAVSAFFSALFDISSFLHEQDLKFPFRERTFVF
jgi:hypothetical protein